MADEDLKAAAKKAIDKDKEEYPGKYKVGDVTKSGAPSPGKAISGSTYTISEGDNPTKIAKALRVTLAQLEAANPNMVATNLQIGGKLTIPKLTDDQRKKEQTVPRSQSVRVIEPKKEDDEKKGEE